MFQSNIPKGHQVPQTVESLQKIMEADAVILENAHKEIASLKQIINDLRQKLKSKKAAT
jgi:hypothetical protein